MAAYGNFRKRASGVHQDKINAAFDRSELKRICEMDETEFGSAFGMSKHKVEQQVPYDFFFFKGTGADVLAVAHLDTVSDADARTCNFVDTQDGTVVYSRALDDRLGAYIILDMLPKLNIEVDVLLTTGEECGSSTAEFFNPPKQYNWVIEFDRGGTDVVLYQYHDKETKSLVQLTGAIVGQGIWSDISTMEHLGVKCFNWGVGYQDYHSARSHAWLNDTWEMLGYFIDFYAMAADTLLSHIPAPKPTSRYSTGWGGIVSTSDDDSWTNYRDWENSNTRVLQALGMGTDSEVEVEDIYDYDGGEATQTDAEGRTWEYDFADDEWVCTHDPAACETDDDLTAAEFVVG